MSDKVIHEDLYEEIISVENLFDAWHTFLKGKRSRMDVQQYARHIEHNIFHLHRELRNGGWRHGSYTSFHVSDPKKRLIHKASVADRLIHHALVRQIEPIFDRSFIFDTWSCRKGKGTHRAVQRLYRLLRSLSKNGRQDVWIFKCDIKKYFASIDRRVLSEFIEKKIHDERALDLVKKIIYSFPHGLPLGNLTSQLFANIYLNPFDHFVKETVKAPIYMRYCDDFVLAFSSKKWLEQQLPVLSSYVTDTLHLTIHPQKIHLRPWQWGIDWLGYCLYPDHVRMRPGTRTRMMRNIEQVVYDYVDRDMDYETCRSIFASYAGLLRLTDERSLEKYMLVLSRCL